jgi:hypothetical protein
VNRQLEVGPDGNVYVGDGALVRRLLPNGSNTVVGGPGSCGNGWCDGVGIGVDGLTNVFAASQFTVWKIAPGAQPIAYTGNTSGYSDGPVAGARFQSVMDAAIDSSSNIFVSDKASIRKIRPDGMVTTLAGSSQSGYANGTGVKARFNSPVGLCLDALGNVYVADSGNNCIRKISPDTSRIGIADDWQLAYFGHIDIDPNDDPDHDGMSNYAEFWAGTDPLDANSVLKILNVQLASDGSPQITWQSVPGKNYSVQYSSDLLNWTALGSVQATGSIASMLDNTFAHVPQRFYRILVADF